jgi:hypothetical protein
VIVTTSHNGSHTVVFKSFARSRAKFFSITIIIDPGCGFAAPFHCTGAAGKGDVMSVFSTKASFALAAAVIGAVSLASFPASAGPPLLQKQCNNLMGCNPNTWTPTHNGNNWNGGSGGFGLSINLAQPTYADEGDCYYVRRRVFIPQVGVVMKRQMICN